MYQNSWTLESNLSFLDLAVAGKTLADQTLKCKPNPFLKKNLKGRSRRIGDPLDSII